MSELITGLPKPDAPLPIKTFGHLEFTWEKKSSLYDTRTYVILTQQTGKILSDDSNPFKITCGATGIQLSGQMANPLGSQSELQDFAQLIGFAWEEHRKLAPKFNETLSGH